MKIKGKRYERKRSKSLEMGMSASQSRLLTLTARMSDLEHQAQSISNSKIRLADKSEEASREYLNALDKQTLTVYNADSKSYVSANARNLTTYQGVSSSDKQRMLVDSYDRLLLTNDIASAHTNAKNRTDLIRSAAEANGINNLDEFLADKVTIEEDDPNYAAMVTYYTNVYNGTEAFLNQMGYTSATESLQESEGFEDITPNATERYDAGAVAYYSHLSNEIKENGYTVQTNENMSDPDWLYDQLTNGLLYLKEYDSTGGDEGIGSWEKVSWSSGDSTLVTKKDETALAKAEAEYELTMKQIQAKDKRFDLDLKTIDTEHTAVQTEIDSVDKVIDKNIERSFKTFG